MSYLNQTIKVFFKNFIYCLMHNAWEMKMAIDLVDFTFFFSSGNPADYVITI